MESVFKLITKKITELLNKFPQIENKISTYEKLLEVKRETIIGLLLLLFCRLLYNSDGFYSISQFIAFFIPIFLTLNSLNDQTKNHSILCRKYWIFFGTLNIIEIIANSIVQLTPLYHFIRLSMFIILFTSKIEHVEIFLDYIINFICIETVKQEEDKSVMDTAKEFFEKISSRRGNIKKEKSIVETL
uniref:Receptor expression-enhancing protein n=1 Tax=Strongyloides stercoralis TaxID=6248 RepID=A0A0K0EEF6_STRER